MISDLQQLRMSDVLDVEDSAEVFASTCPRTGIPLWALIRTQFLRQILSSLIYNGTPFGWSSASIPRATIARTLLRSSAHNVLRAGLRGDICFMTSSLGLIERGGQYFDRLGGYFVDCAPAQSFVWEDQYEWRWRSARAFDRVIYHAPLQVTGAVIGRLKVTSAMRRASRELVNAVARRTSSALGLVIEESALASLTSSLARRLAATPFLFDAYVCQLRRRGVRLLFKEDACYSSSAIVLAAAHAEGIQTAEFQHGALSSAHDAYNMAPAVAAHAVFRETLPRYFLGYGEWWNRQINAPIRKLAMGNPHRDQTMTGRNPLGRVGNVLLVLGDGIETNRYISFIRSIAPAARSRGLRPVFRPHPMERQRLAGTASPAEFEIDKNSDIYDAFDNAAIVVSEISTGLFEAIGLVDHIVIWNTPKATFNFPEHPFQAIDSADDLCELLRTGGLCKINQEDVEGIWAPSWRENYLNFLASTLGALSSTQTRTA